ncbi:IclR family transcriptional regulator [Sulfobacillus harzensis]|uniref:IclR family transcriptional regulator n=1 Tax=Sulfobacillus harzensis TaxID=2729629 RepID=A0A7Y0L5H5_9FIRM|nr:IclR family transcriptional regulator [Sulfobacillus harzensis]NMP23096.1 IclR family transcriptional regulator [Sulfobacillus harzensis]
MRTDEGEGVAVIGKMARVLDLLADDPSLNPSQLSARLGMPRTTVHRILQTMIREGIVTDAHHVGSRLIRWAWRALKESELRTISGPVLENLVGRFGETASLFVRSGATRLCLDRREGTEAIRHNIEVGSAIPIHVGSAGRILLAWLQNEERSRLIQASIEWSGVPPAVPGPDWLAIRSSGWTSTAGERDPILASVSVPVFGAAHQVVAALSLSGPRMRFTPERLRLMAEALKMESVLLSEHIQSGTRDPTQPQQG